MGCDATVGGDLWCGPNGAEHVKTRQCIQPGPVPDAIANYEDTSVTTYDLASSACA